MQKFEGKWHCSYWYPSNHDDSEEVSEYDVTIQTLNDHYAMQSLPNEDESYLFARFAIDDGIVSGNWQENTSPHREFKGAIYSGGFQLVLNDEGTAMVGKWVGHGNEKGKLEIYDGRWEIRKL